MFQTWHEEYGSYWNACLVSRVPRSDIQTRKEREIFANNDLIKVRAAHLQNVSFGIGKTRKKTWQIALVLALQGDRLTKSPLLFFRAKVNFVLYVSSGHLFGRASSSPSWLESSNLEALTKERSLGRAFKYLAGQKSHLSKKLSVCKIVCVRGRKLEGHPSTMLSFNGVLSAIQDTNSILTFVRSFVSTGVVEHMFCVFSAIIYRWINLFTVLLVWSCNGESPKSYLWAFYLERSAWTPVLNRTTNTEF